MKQYPDYKDSGVEWLGAIPNHWEVDRLKWSIKMCRNGIWGNDPDGENDIICVRVADFDRSRSLVILDTPTMRSISMNERVDRVLRRGDLLLEKSGGGEQQPVGFVVMYDHNEEAVTSNFVARLPMQVDQEPRYWKYLHRFLYQARINTRSIKQTTGIQNLDSYSYICERAPFPTITEQIAIADYLDRKTTQIDQSIARKQLMIELLEEERAAVISTAVTQGLDPTVPRKPSGIPWLGNIPEGWQVKKLKRVAKMESGHTPRRSVEEYWEDCTIPWVSLNDTKHLAKFDYISDTKIKISELGMENSSAHLLPERAVIFTRDATIGLAAIMTKPMAVSQHIIAWICGPEIVPEFLLNIFYTMKDELNRLTTGSTLKTIGMPDINSLTSPIPPLEEQAAIVTYINQKTAQIDQAIAKAKNQIALLEEYRAALIAQAVTGKIDVREEDAS